MHADTHAALAALAHSHEALVATTGNAVTLIERLSAVTSEHSLAITHLEAHAARTDARLDALQGTAPATQPGAPKGRRNPRPTSDPTGNAAVAREAKPASWPTPVTPVRQAFVSALQAAGMTPEAGRKAWGAAKAAYAQGGDEIAAFGPAAATAAIAASGERKSDRPAAQVATAPTKAPASKPEAPAMPGPDAAVSLARRIAAAEARLRGGEAAVNIVGPAGSKLRITLA